MAEPAVSTQSSSTSHTEAPADLDELIAVQEEIFCERQHESRRLAQRADLALAGGVTSSWQITRPQPVWLSHGKGSKIYDVDGNEYVDLHGDDLVDAGRGLGQGFGNGGFGFAGV